MPEETAQMTKWSGDFGKEYTDRNIFTVEELDNLYIKNYGISRTSMNKEFVNSINKESKILEVGSNVGNQLTNLQSLGFSNLYGIELQQYAVEISKKRTKNINIIQGSAFEIPFKDNLFNLVYTSGVLIHISPLDIEKVIHEIYRTSNKFIWGFEYYSEVLQEVKYRNNNKLLWKRDFKQLYLDLYPDLELVNEKKYKYFNSNNFDSMFLLKKR